MSASAHEWQQGSGDPEPGDERRFAEHPLAARLHERREWLRSDGQAAPEEPPATETVNGVAAAAEPPGVPVPPWSPLSRLKDAWRETHGSAGSPSPR
jgi:hypothetical protein